jgi:hypothetical protein
MTWYAGSQLSSQCICVSAWSRSASEQPFSSAPLVLESAAFHITHRGDSALSSNSSNPILTKPPLSQLPLVPVLEKSAGKRNSSSCSSIKLPQSQCVLISLECTQHGNTTAAVLFGKAAPSSQLRLVSVLGEVSRDQQQQQFSNYMPNLSQLCLATVTRRTALSRCSPHSSHGKHRRVNKNMR